MPPALHHDEAFSLLTEVNDRIAKFDKCLFAPAIYLHHDEAFSLLTEVNDRIASNDTCLFSPAMHQYHDAAPSLFATGQSGCGT
jgi:hypothetical protein